MIKYFTLLSIAFLFSILLYSQSDECLNAVVINPTFTTCSFQAGSSANATESLPSCSGGGNADDDVWYTFVANSTNMTITIDPTTGYDAVIQLYTGTCGSLTSIQCEDVNGPNGDEVLNNQTLTIGNTYFIRVYNYSAGWGSATFNICVTGLAPPINDTPCNAYALSTVTPSCNFEIYTNSGAGNSTVPTPSGCGGSTPFDGGYLGSDVWFSVIVPASGELDIHTLSVDFADGAMALYSGACGALTLVECDDDGEPGDGILMPHIYATGLTPGATMYIRVWEYDNDNNGQFGICVSTPDNDDCANSQEICDLNGYGGITSSAYTVDFPSNMTGTGQNGIANSNPTAPFGQGYGGVSPVQIDNNSWLTFTADATTAELFVQVNYCSNGNGMQMQIFSGTNCTNFTAVSTFLETTNSQTITASGLTPGNQYYIMIDGFAGDICSYTISATSGVQVVEITSTKTNICLGDTASLDAEVTGTGSYTYTWSSTPAGLSSSSPSVNVNPSQNTLYTVDITGVCGSVSTANLYVTVNPLPTVNITASDTEICLNQVISLNGNVSSGTAPFTHLWSGNGQPFLNTSSSETPNFNGSTDGDYTLLYELTDTIGCTTSDSIILKVNPIPFITISGIDSICNGDTTLLVASGGTSFLWSNTSTNDSIFVSPTSDTNYSITVTDSNSCNNSGNIDVIVNPLPNPSISGTLIICQGNSTSLTASGGNTYSWSTGDTSATINITPITDSSYTVTAINANGCFDTTSVTVQVNPKPTASLSGIDTICIGNSTTLFANGGNSYTWNNGSTLDSLIVSPTNDSIFSVVANINSCLDTAYYTVVVNSLPIPIITGIDTICNGELTTLTASGGISYSWNTGSTNDSIIVSPSLDSTYSVTITDVNNCSNSTNINVVVNTLPNPTINGSSLICSGSSTTLTASGGTSYLWNNGASTPDITVSPIIDSTYIVTVSNANNCSDTVSTTVQVVSNPNGLITSSNGSNFLCIGNATTLSASGGGAYTWNNGSTLDSLVVSPILDSTYSVIVNIGGCVDTAYFAITVNSLPIINFSGVDTICDGESTTLTASGGTSYLWNTGSTNDSIVVSPTTNTTYNVVATDVNNCSNSAIIDVVVNNLPTITISSSQNDTICEGQTSTLAANGANSYEWSTTELTPSIDVSPTVNTTYNVEGTNINGCKNTASFTLNVATQPTASIMGITEICENGETTLTASGGLTYLWSNTEITPSITVSPSDTTVYSVVSIINSCVSDTAKITVNVIPNPSINAYRDTLINLGQSVQLLVQGDAPFLWSPTNDLSCITCENPVATPTETTVYCAEVTINNCSSSACVTVEVENICGELFVPDAFSPNNDGNNDCLKVYSNCLDEVLFRVYSRWGELIYESTEINGCWDGTYHGKELNSGAYAYTVKALLVNGVEVDIKGNTTLFK